MSESKAKQRYWLTFLLQDLPAGASLGVETLHLTVIPWFVTDILTDQEVCDSFQETFQELSSLQIEVTETTPMSGREVEVSLVQPADKLKQIHQAALVWFTKIGGRWAVKNPYAGAEYLPHIRRRSGADLRPGQKITLSHLSLVRADRAENWQRQVAARVDLKEPA